MRFRASGLFKSARAGDRVFGGALLLPAAAVFAVFVFYPLARVVWMSVQGSNIFGQSTGFVGPQNFKTLFTDSDFAQTMSRTAVFCLGVVVGRLVTGLLVAMPLATEVRGSRVCRALLTTPMAASFSAHWYSLFEFRSDWSGQWWHQMTWRHLHSWKAA